MPSGNVSITHVITIYSVYVSLCFYLFVCLFECNSAYSMGPLEHQILLESRMCLYVDSPLISTQATGEVLLA